MFKLKRSKDYTRKERELSKENSQPKSQKQKATSKKAPSKSQTVATDPLQAIRDQVSKSDRVFTSDSNLMNTSSPKSSTAQPTKKSQTHPSSKTPVRDEPVSKKGVLQTYYCEGCNTMFGHNQSFEVRTKCPDCEGEERFHKGDLLSVK